MLGAVSAVLLLATAQQPAITSRYTRLSSCREWAAGDVANNPQEDWIVYRCRGLPGQAVWITYVEGTRMQIGFGTRQNAAGIFETDRDKNWPIEWRGHLTKGRFVPSAAIIRVRVRFDETDTSDLAVFRLRRDGTSCLVSTIVSTNAEARAIADAPALGEDCSNWADIIKRLSYSSPATAR